jgi:phosphate transport system protein
MRIREHFDNEIADLHSQLYDLGELALIAINQSIEALARQDNALAEQIIKDDKQINQAQRHVEDHAITLIARQQPVARDLRAILTAICASTELERIADYAKAIARLVIGPEGTPPLAAPPELLKLGTAAHSVLIHARAALARGDSNIAHALGAEEVQIDRQYQQVRKQLATDLNSHSHPARVADLLAIAHYYERIADRSTNLAERVIYEANATMVELNP